MAGGKHDKHTTITKGSASLLNKSGLFKSTLSNEERTMLKQQLQQQVDTYFNQFQTIQRDTHTSEEKAQQVDQLIDRVRDDIRQLKGHVHRDFLMRVVLREIYGSRYNFVSDIPEEKLLDTLLKTRDSVKTALQMGASRRPAGSRVAANDTGSETVYTPQHSS